MRCSPLTGDLVHLVGRSCASPSPASRSTQVLTRKCVPSFLGQAEQLVDVALAVTDMDASSWIAEQRRGLPHVVQPPDALLLLDRNPRRIDLLLERGGPLELLPGPEFHRRQPERQTLGRHRQARVHQDAADRVRSQATGLVPAAVDALGDPDRLCVLSLKAELGRVMEHQNGPSVATARSQVD